MFFIVVVHGLGPLRFRQVLGVWMVYGPDPLGSQCSMSADF